MDKQQIINEMKRLGANNGGKAPGILALKRSGIQESVWRRYWPRISDAQSEAGFKPNALQLRSDDEVLLIKYCELARDLQRLPIDWDLRERRKSDKSFPAITVFGDHFGSKEQLVSAVAEYCRANADYGDVLVICEDYLKPTPKKTVKAEVNPAKPVVGYVYLMQSGKHFKIGRTDFPVGHREYQLGIILPIPPNTLHYIETDDPVGVEAYWHKRFDDKRRPGHGARKGEWFDLTSQDVAAFKRWKKIA